MRGIPGYDFPETGGDRRAHFHSCLFEWGLAVNCNDHVDLAAVAVQGGDFGWLLNTTVVASTEIPSQTADGAL
jgi:hypothetical protein